MDRLGDVAPQVFFKSIAEQLGEDSIEVLCQAYHINPDMDKCLFTTAMLRWSGDIVFDGSYTELIRY